MKFYVNGKLVSQRAVTGTLDVYDTSVFIGKTPYKEYYTSGEFDDYRIFDRALTEEEVFTLYSEKQLSNSMFLFFFKPIRQQ